MWPELISAAAKGFTTYLGNRAQKKAQEEAYRRQMQRLEEQQALETQSMDIGMDYEQGLANRGIGEDAAATGMTGSSITRRLGDITFARNEAMRKFALSQLLQRKALTAQKREQDLQAKAAQKAQIYQGLGAIGGVVASNYLVASKMAAPKEADRYRALYPSSSIGMPMKTTNSFYDTFKTNTQNTSPWRGAR